MIKAVFFDLDGTLLPLSNEKFTKLYFGSLYKVFDQEKFTMEQAIQAIWTGTYAMIQQEDGRDNYTKFKEAFTAFVGNDLIEDYMQRFLRYYETDFKIVKQSTWQSPPLLALVQFLKEHNIPMVLATNPMFPRIATEQRVEWAGLQKTDFVHISVQENSHYCKPSLHYYRELLALNHWQPEEVLMIGNDAEEDMIAGKLGCQTYLVTDCLLSKVPSSSIPCEKGNAEQCLQAVKEKIHANC